MFYVNVNKFFATGLQYPPLSSFKQRVVPGQCVHQSQNRYMPGVWDAEILVQYVHGERQPSVALPSEEISLFLINRIHLILFKNVLLCMRDFPEVLCTIITIFLLTYPLLLDTTYIQNSGSGVCVKTG